MVDGHTYKHARTHAFVKFFSLRLKRTKLTHFARIQAQRRLTHTHARAVGLSLGAKLLRDLLLLRGEAVICPRKISAEASGKEAQAAGAGRIAAKRGCQTVDPPFLSDSLQ